jgi:hypothetical protein
MSAMPAKGGIATFLERGLKSPKQSMKKPLFAPLSLWLFVLVAQLLAGCTNDQDDKDFYYRGWLKPQQGADERLMHGDGRGTDIDFTR